MGFEEISIRVAEVGSISGPIFETALSAVELNLEYYYRSANVKGRVVVDIGGYIGDSSLFFISRGARAIYMYEPSKKYFEVAKKNLSQFANVHCFNYGIGCTRRVANLSGRFMGKRIGETEGEKIEVRNINTVLSQVILNEGRIGLFKIDCEGCEWEILRCLDYQILESIDSIYIEIHDGGEPRSLISKLLEHGYTLKTKPPSYYFVR